MTRIGFHAAYDGPCDECDTPIRAGDHIMRNTAGGYVHVECPDAAGTVGREPCASCFQVPSVTGVCGCEATA